MVMGVLTVFPLIAADFEVQKHGCIFRGSLDLGDSNTRLQYRWGAGVAVAAIDPKRTLHLAEIDRP